MKSGIWVSCAEQESYLIAHVCSIAVSMNMFSPTWIVVPHCGCHLRSFIWVWWIVFAVWTGCVRVNFIIWFTEESPCACSTRFTTERTPPMYEYLHRFTAARNTRASTALRELTLVP